MKNSRLVVFGVLLIALAVTAGCGRNIQPVPTVDTRARETSLAGTAVVAFGTATPTSSPTETPVPTAAFSSYGTSVTRQQDGSTLFVDRRAGIQIVFPANWLSMRVGEPEYYQAWEGEGSRNPELLDAITSIQNLDLNRFRITAFEMTPENTRYGNIPKINVVFVQDDDRTLKRIEYDERTARSVLKDYKFLPSTFQTTASGLEFLMIHYQWQATSADHQSYTGYYKGFLFKVPTGMVAIDLFIPMEIKEPMEQELGKIFESVIFLEP